MCRGMSSIHHAEFLASSYSFPSFTDPKEMSPQARRSLPYSTQACVPAAQPLVSDQNAAGHQTDRPVAHKNNDSDAQFQGGKLRRSLAQVAVRLERTPSGFHAVSCGSGECQPHETEPRSSQVVLDAHACAPLGHPNPKLP